MDHDLNQPKQAFAGRSISSRRDWRCSTPICTWSPPTRATANCSTCPARLVEAGTALYDIALYVARRGDLGEGDPVAARRRARRSARQRTEHCIATHWKTRTKSRIPLVAPARWRACHQLRRRVGTGRSGDSAGAANANLEGRVEERTATLLRVNSELESARQEGGHRQPRQDPLPRCGQPRSAAAAERRAALYRDPARARRRDRAGCARALDRGLTKCCGRNHVGTARHVAHRLRRTQTAAGALPAARSEPEDRGRVRTRGAREIDRSDARRQLRRSASPTARWSRASSRTSSPTPSSTRGRVARCWSAAGGAATASGST